VNNLCREIGRNLVNLPDKISLLENLVKNSDQRIKFINESIIDSIIEIIKYSKTSVDLSYNVNICIKIKHFSSEKMQIKFIELL
jgi:hypothetical protein